MINQVRIEEEEEDLELVGEHHPKSTGSRWHSPKLFLKILVLCVVLFTVFQTYSLYFGSPTSLPSSSSSSSWPASFFSFADSECANNQKKLRQSVTFLPLKDLRYEPTAAVGHTWFMSTLNDTHVEGEVQHVHLPSESSRGRLLCLKGRDKHNGALNYYAMAWSEALPENATLKEGLTFVSNSNYVYNNIWHGLSAIVPMVGWHLRDKCRLPTSLALYFKGEVRTQVPPWLSMLLTAVFGDKEVNMEGFEENDGPVCFEEAVVTRHNEAGMSKARLEEAFDLMRCKARVHCNVSANINETVVRVTMLLRSGARSFKNDTRVINIFESECNNIQGCNLKVAYASNLTVCQQVKLMSETDVLISAHGAQLTNLFLMDKGSSVMEFFPKGWLKLAGVGQYVFHWLAGWSGMHHQGAWHDSDGPPCEYPEDDVRCMSVYKNAQIGHNETHFREWARIVFSKTRAGKLEDLASKPKQGDQINCGCPELAH